MIDVTLEAVPPLQADRLGQGHHPDAALLQRLGAAVGATPPPPRTTPTAAICGATLETSEGLGGDIGDVFGLTTECETPRLHVPLLTLPRSCSGPLAAGFEALAWDGRRAFGEALTRGAFGEPLGLGGCENIGFGPEISASPTSRSASSPSGLDFDLNVHDEGLTDPEGIANSDIKEGGRNAARGGDGSTPPRPKGSRPARSASSKRDAPTRPSAKAARRARRSAPRKPNRRC